MAEPVIELNGVSRRYGLGEAEFFALKDFDLTIKQGEFVMIMGPSGCGKTTLLNILGLLDRPTEGQFRMDGESVRGMSLRRRAKLRSHKIGFVFQNFNLINDLTVVENVALPLVYAGAGKTERLERAAAMLEKFKLKDKQYYLPAQLSGGQQQKVAIARALVAGPEIILADEPTGNLDTRSSRLVMEELSKLHDEGNTIIMVTHNPNLTSFATRVIWMVDGKIDVDRKTVADRDLPKLSSESFKSDEKRLEKKAEAKERKTKRKKLKGRKGRRK